ncbi:Pal1-domain-containing protein [Thozetella sp. PMI_491]|nr:Pal1-domain-containing protein [Thozetella sp. PMI_491]
MAAAQPDLPDQPASAGLTLNLSSNNPFRNRAASPSLPQSPASPFDDPPSGRPVSRNPFLDPNLTSKSSAQNLKTASENMTSTETKASPTAEELFDSLTIEEKKGPPPPRPGPPKDGSRPPPRRPPPGRENMPPPGRRGPPPGPHHRPTRSQEEALRARRLQGGRPQDDNRSPSRRPDPRRPRRNSESSVADPDKPLTEEEKKAREQRRRERERRHREHKDKKPTNRKLDIIDQLDATSIYGTGLFHHDGPYDALNPHRNRQGSRRAPMQAYPKDSLNNVLGGAGPLNARPDHSTLMGHHHDDEAFKDFSTSAKEGKNFPGAAPRGNDSTFFDPLSRSVLHGDQTMGLGSTTFLEGTPAARTAIQKRDEERAQAIATDGLQRKKSLAQRIRNINRGPREYPPSGRMMNPDGSLRSPRSPPEATSMGSQGSSGERNPFFSEFETGKKGEDVISVRKADGSGSGVTSPTSPKLNFALERRATSDGTSGVADEPKQPSGLLARVKSLKGGRRTKPAPPPPPAGELPSPPAGAVPGTAV